MSVEQIRNIIFRYRIHHLLLWISLFIFWRAYYVLADSSRVIIGNAFLSTLIAALSFYITYLWLVPRWLNRKGVIPFLFFCIPVLGFLALTRSYFMYLEFHYYFPGGEYWNLRDTLKSSFLDTGYAMAVATVGRLIVDKYEVRAMMDALANEKLKTELNYLKNQVNPHFLFNIHNSIYFLINENPALAGEVTLKLSHIMRYQIYDCAAETVTLNQEIQNLKNYIDLEKMRLGRSVKVGYRDSIISGSRSLYPFILLAVVENCFKHVGGSGERTINISIEQNDDWLSLETLNTTGNREFNGKRLIKGVGLQNLKRRLQLLYQNDFLLENKEESSQYETRLKIKLL